MNYSLINPPENNKAQNFTRKKVYSDSNFGQ